MGNLPEKPKEMTGKYGFYMQEPADSGAAALVESAGADMLTADASGKEKSKLCNRRTALAAMEMMQDMVKKDGSALHVSWKRAAVSFID